MRSEIFNKTVLRSGAALVLCGFIAGCASAPGDALNTLSHSSSCCVLYNQLPISHYDFSTDVEVDLDKDYSVVRIDDDNEYDVSYAYATDIPAGWRVLRVVSLPGYLVSLDLLHYGHTRLVPLVTFLDQDKREINRQTDKLPYSDLDRYTRGVLVSRFSIPSAARYVVIQADPHRAGDTYKAPNARPMAGMPVMLKGGAFFNLPSSDYELVPFFHTGRFTMKLS